MVTHSVARPAGKWRSHLFVGGHLAFEITNTILSRHAEHPEDLIDGVEGLADWSKSVGLAEVTAGLVSADLSRVRAVRAVIHKLFSAVAQGRPVPSDAVANLLRLASQRFEAKARPRLDTELAWQAVHALTALPHGRIGECPSCGWLFLDTSKGGRRRWCTMSVCGTREKVRMHRQRHD